MTVKNTEELMFSLLKIVATVLVLALTVAAHANPPCASAYRSYSTYAAPYAAPYVAKVQQYYFVGDPIRAEAVVQAEMRASPDYQEFQSYQQFKSEFQAFQAWKEQQSQQQAVPPGALGQVAPQTQMQASCVRCHSGPDPKGGLLLDGSALAPGALKAIREKLLAGEMPPPTSPEEKAGFSNEQAGQVILEAIELLHAGGPAREELPPPQPPPLEGNQP